jgi:anti-sigma factor ChrR (cupin superfamily)
MDDRQKVDATSGANRESRACDHTDRTSGSWEIAGGGGLVAPTAGSQHYASAVAAWQPTASPGFWIKPLFTDAAHGEKTMLMKVDPGAFAPLHTHAGEFEQVYVIEGTFYDQHRTMAPGDFCCRTPDAPHLSGSKDGAILMVIYTPRPTAEG